MTFDPFIFANVCVGVAGLCYLLACVAFAVTGNWWWAGAYANYACANGFLIVVALATKAPH